MLFDNWFEFLIAIILIQFSSIVCKPKLTLISPNVSKTVLNGKTTLDIASNTTVRLKCDGSQPIEWSFPSNDPVIAFSSSHHLLTHSVPKESVPISSQAKITSKCFKNKKCSTEVTLTDLEFQHTGNYSCYYQGDAKSLDSIYIFVNGKKSNLKKISYEHDKLLSV